MLPSAKPADLKKIHFSIGIPTPGFPDLTGTLAARNFLEPGLTVTGQPGCLRLALFQVAACSQHGARSGCKLPGGPSQLGQGGHAPAMPLSQGTAPRLGFQPAQSLQA